MLKLPKLGIKIQNYIFTTKILNDTVVVDIDFTQCNLKYGKAHFILTPDGNYPNLVCIDNTIKLLLNSATKNNVKFTYYAQRSYLEFKYPNSIGSIVNNRFTCNSYLIS